MKEQKSLDMSNEQLTSVECNEILRSLSEAKTWITNMQITVNRINSMIQFLCDSVQAEELDPEDDGG